MRILKDNLGILTLSSVNNGMVGKLERYIQKFDIVPEQIKIKWV